MGRELGRAGPSAQSWRCARAGEWICFLDQDDWWYPNKLEVCSLHVGSADIMYHDLDIYDGVSHEPRTGLHSRQLTDDPFTDLMLNGNALFTSATVVKKAVFQQVDGMAEDKALVTLEDYDCWLKIARITKKFFYISRSLGAYSQGAGLFGSLKHVDSPEALWRRNVGYLRTSEEKKLATSIMKFNQARMYHNNGRYGRAFVLYLQAGPTFLVGRLIRRFRLKSA